MSLKLNLKETTTEKGEPCKGRVYRGVVSRWYTSYGGIAERRELRLLKRKSCPGCEKCGVADDYLQEDIQMMDIDDDLLKDIKHGKLYRIKYTWYRDLETGHYDDYDFEVVEVKDETE